MTKDIKFEDYLILDPGSHTGLCWKSTNKPAGYIQQSKTSNCIVITINKTRYMATKVLWEMVYGKLPEGAIVYTKDRNPLNIKIENLTLEKPRGASLDRKVHKNNKSVGLPGVTFEQRDGCLLCIGYYRNLEGRTVRKAFSANSHGLLPAMKMAVQARLEGISKL